MLHFGIDDKSPTWLHNTPEQHGSVSVILAVPAVHDDLPKGLIDHGWLRMCNMLAGHW